MSKTIAGKAMSFLEIMDKVGSVCSAYKRESDTCTSVQMPDLRKDFSDRNGLNMPLPEHPRYSFEFKQSIFLDDTFCVWDVSSASAKQKGLFRTKDIRFYLVECRFVSGSKSHDSVKDKSVYYNLDGERCTESTKNKLTIIHSGSFCFSAETKSGAELLKKTQKLHVKGMVIVTASCADDHSAEWGVSIREAERFSVTFE